MRLRMTPVRVPAAAAALALALTTAPARGDDRQEAKSFEKEIKVTVKSSYWLALPKGYESDTSKKWPLMLFLHGAGESGSNLENVKEHGPPKVVGSKEDFPFILVSPQSPGRGWNPDTLNALLDDVSAHYRVDPDRVYLTGLSMGGYGTWALAAAHPGRFAAIAPICGGGNPRDADKLKGLPTWVFHGAKDPTVPLARSQEMVDALKKAGAAEVKFTVYPDAGHDSWTETYNPRSFMSGSSPTSAGGPRARRGEGRGRLRFEERETRDEKRDKSVRDRRA